MTDTKSILAKILNEASVRAFEIDPVLRRASLHVNVLALFEGDAEAPGVEIELQFLGVARLGASLRAGHWSDRNAEVLDVELAELAAIIGDFGPLPIYGDKFLDSDDPWVPRWVKRLSLDWQPIGATVSHTFDFFQEGPAKHLDLRMWFDDLHVLSSLGSPTSLADLAAASDRWWAAMRAGDPRTMSSGIFPLD